MNLYNEKHVAIVKLKERKTQHVNFFQKVQQSCDNVVCVIEFTMMRELRVEELYIRNYTCIYML